MPYCSKKLFMNRMESFYNTSKKQSIQFRGIFKSFRQNKNTKSVDFLNKYHKNKLLLNNKLAYLAGLVDGEGYLKIEKHGTIRLIIGMCDKKTIYWIKNNFGGNVKHQKTEQGRKFYVWGMNQGKDLFYLLLLLIPFLINKKQKLISGFELILNRLKNLHHTIEHFHKGEL